MDTIKEEVRSAINVKRIIKYSILLLMVGLLALAVIRMLNQEPQQSSTNMLTLPVSRGNIIETIDGTGTIKPKEQEAVIARIAGTIDQVYVHKGDKVEQGQLLLSISNNEILSQSRQNQLQWEIDQYDLQTLLDPSVIKDTQIRSAQLKIQQYELQLADKLEEKEKLLVKAPFAGTLLDLNHTKGQRVNSGNQLATFVSSNEIEVVADFSEIDILSIAEGMEAQVWLRGLGKTYTGKVQEIAFQGSVSSGGTSTFGVIIKLDDPDEEIRSGMQTYNTIYIVRDRDADLFLYKQAPGYIRYAQTENIISDVSGTITEIYRKSGDTLTAGDPILLLSNPDIDRQILEIENQLAIAKEDLELLLSPKEIDIKRQQLKVEQSYSRLLMAQEDVKNLNIYAPFAGTVFDIFVKPGDDISRQTDQRLGEELLVLTGIEKNLLEIQVDELDIGRIKIGQQAQVRVDALPGVILDAEVTEIAQEALIQDGISKYMVTLEVDKAEGVRNGMTATAVIYLERRENVLQVPAEAVTNRNGVNMVQILVDGGKTSYQPVQTGITNGRFTEIVAGIEEGTEIVVASTSRQSIQMGMPGGMPGGIPGGGQMRLR